MARLSRLLWALFVLTACRAATTSYEYPDDLLHPNYVKRSKAALEFAKRRDLSQLPVAFRLLVDPEAHIRTIAHDAIRGMVAGGEDFGYRPYLPEAVRDGIARRWEAWWRQHAGGEGPGADPEVLDG